MMSETATLANAETPADVEPRRLLAQGAESVRQPSNASDDGMIEPDFLLVKH
jgi:hypothetical protein